MTKQTEKQHALYLVKDGEHPKLFHADDLEAARADGWKEPTFRRGNGAEWNAEGEEAQRDAAATMLKANDEFNGKKAAEKAKADEKARMEAEKAAADAPETPDMKVQIVDPPKKSKK